MKPLIPFNVQKNGLSAYKALSSINDDFKKGVCYGRPLFQAWLPPNLNNIPNICGRKNCFSSVVMVLALRAGIPGSNPVQTLYFCHAFIYFFYVTELVRKNVKQQFYCNTWTLGFHSQ